MIDTTMTKPDVHIRWMNRADVEFMLPFDQHGTGSRWSEEDFVWHLRQRNTIGLVAEDVAGELVGYAMYRLTESRVELMKLVVRRDVWGNGYGGRLLEAVNRKIATHRRPLGVALIPEHNLPAQLLFRELGWATTGIMVDGCLEFVCVLLDDQ